MTASRITAQPQDAFNDYARIVADQQLGCAIGFAEKLDADRLREAVAALIAAQPVLGCRFVAEGCRAWHEPVAGADVVAELAADAPWERAVVEAGQTLAPDGAHLAVTLVRGAAHDALAVRVDHTAADGQGAKACVELLAAAYSGALDADPRAAATDRSWRRLRKAAGWPRMLAAVTRREDPPPTWGLPRASERAGEGAGPRRHDLVTLPAERFSAAKAWAKERGCTVNDVVLTAWYRALFAKLAPAEGQPMRVRVSFDQRRYLDPADPMPAASNLSSVEAVGLARVADEPFDATLARVSAEMNRLKAGSPGLGSAVLLEALYRLRGFSAVGEQMVAGMRRGQAAGRTYPFLSNFGVLDPERWRFGDARPTRAVVLPVAAHPPFAMLGASSYAGEFTLSLGFAEGEVDPTLAPELLAAIAGELGLTAGSGLG